jgi:PTH1 family peptidyl-tRNA hydrolase
MRLIVGLGNPGEEYVGTRHNVGFAVVERLAERWSLGPWKKKFAGRMAQGRVGEENVALLEPLTYMNLSGRSVAEAADFFECRPGDTMVVLDDVDLPLGRLRMRGAGGAGGHKGLTDVLARLGSQDVPRLRLGVGRPGHGDTADHVLRRFAETERPVVDETVAKAADAIETWLRSGLNAAMNQANRPGDEHE